MRVNIQKKHQKISQTERNQVWVEKLQQIETKPFKPCFTHTYTVHSL